MKYIFWICWSVEIVTVFCWILKQISMPYEPDPLSYYIGLYLVIVLAIRFAFEMDKASTVLVVLPAMPLIALASIFLMTPYKDAVVKAEKH